MMDILEKLDAKRQGSLLQEYCLEQQASKYYPVKMRRKCTFRVPPQHFVPENVS